MDEEQKPEINMPLIRKVLAHIEENMLRLEMRTYYYFKPEWVEGQESKKWPECGTKACFAGWGYFLSNPGVEPRDAMNLLFTDGRGSSIRKEAQKLFGFTTYEAFHVFEGEASVPRDATTQLEKLKQQLNNVFEERGMAERV